MKIAVVIVNFNSGALLAQCLDHLNRQSRRADSILVIDNASHDDSLDNLPACPELSIDKREENLGFAAANNIAFQRLVDTDYFITLNPDAFAETDFIQQFEAAAKVHPFYGSFACRMMKSDDVLDGAGDIYHVSGLAWRHLHNRHYTPLEHTRRDIFAACAGAAMYRAEDIREMNGFDDRFFCYMEDVDLGYRMQLQGKRCLYVPAAVVTHMGSAIVKQYAGFAAYHGQRNLVWAMVKNTPAPLLPIVLPAHFVMSLALGIHYLLKGQLSIYLRAKADAILGLGEVYQHRKRIQKGRKTTSWEILKLLNFSFRRH